MDELKERYEQLKDLLNEMEDKPSCIMGKLGELMNDDEFITVAAGFVLGAAVTGLSALAISSLKK